MPTSLLIIQSGKNCVWLRNFKQLWKVLDEIKRIKSNHPNLLHLQGVRRPKNLQYTKVTWFRILFGKEIVSIWITSHGMRNIFRRGIKKYLICLNRPILWGVTNTKNCKTPQHRDLNLGSWSIAICYNYGFGLTRASMMQRQGNMLKET